MSDTCGVCRREFPEGKVSSSSGTCPECSSLRAKRPRVDHKKEWYVAQLALALQKAHAAECRVRELENQTLFRRIFGRKAK